MILAALVCYGIALNIAGPVQRRLGSLPVIGRALAIAFVLTAPFGIATISDSEFAWGSAAAVAVLGAFGTGVAYVLMASNAGRFGSTRASSTTYLIPGVSIVLGVVVRGEQRRADRTGRQRRRPARGLPGQHRRSARAAGRPLANFGCPVRD